MNSIFSAIKTNIKTAKLIVLNTLILLSLLLTPSISYASKGKLVLIIDDMGYNKHDIDAFRLHGDITYAILPHTPFSQQYADLAYLANRDVILHIPMESINGKALGPGAITEGMNEQQIHKVLGHALVDVPNAIGINNHMGSLLTQKRKPINYTLTFLKQHNLFFLDSKTSPLSVVEEQAAKYDVISFHRNVFIDNDLSEEAMLKQFNLLIRIAQKYRHAVGIAHPYPETVTFLKKHLPTLEQKGVELTRISDILPERHLQIAKTVAEKSHSKD